MRKVSSLIHKIFDREAQGLRKLIYHIIDLELFGQKSMGGSKTKIKDSQAF